MRTYHSRFLMKDWLDQGSKSKFVKPQIYQIYFHVVSGVFYGATTLAQSSGIEQNYSALTDKYVLYLRFVPVHL